MNRPDPLRNHSGAQAPANESSPMGPHQPLPSDSDDGSDLDPAHFDSLHPHDDAALDALVSSHFRIEDVPAELRPTAQGLTNLLSLLDHPGSGTGNDHRTLIDVTLARISQARRSEARANPDLSLSGADDDALEALLTAGYHAERVPASLRYRAKRVANLLALLDAPVARSASPASLEREADPAALAQRTLARVQRAIEEHEDRLTLTTVGAAAVDGERRRGWSLRVPDLVSAAALLFLGVMLLAPMAMGVREYNRRQSCASNMHAAGVAFGAYAGDFQSHLPVASAARSGTPWWHVGKGVERSNSANLFMLSRASYTPLEQLACCGNPHAPRQADADWLDWRTLDEVSYSYQCQFADRRANWSSGRLVVVLSDASPVIRRAIRREAILPFENSPNHNRRGQNVLLNDGSGMWLTTPNLPFGRADNVWLPRNIEAEIARMRRSGATDPIDGTEEPEREDDSFVGP